MIKIENQNMELPQMGREPTMGYAEEYIEKTMISGLTRRISRGKRFYANLSYAYLLDSQRALISELLETQRIQGYLMAEISTPYGSYSGKVLLDLNQDQSRFSYSDVLKDYVWTNWKLTIRGAGLE